MVGLKGQVEFTIGRLATAANVNVETVRYYQKIGLIDEPQKPQQGYRKYSYATLEKIKFIRRAQKLGFSLQEIADLFELGNGQCKDVRIRAEEKCKKIEKQITDLQALKNTLTSLVSACNTGNDKQTCPIVETLLAEDS